LANLSSSGIPKVEVNLKHIRRLNEAEGICLVDLVSSPGGVMERHAYNPSQFVAREYHPFRSSTSNVTPIFSHTKHYQLFIRMLFNSELSLELPDH